MKNSVEFKQNGGEKHFLTIDIRCRKTHRLLNDQLVTGKFIATCKIYKSLIGEFLIMFT